MTPRAFIFPGQGSQDIGMGREIAAAFPLAREVFQEIDDTLGQGLFRLMTEGPEEDLRLTENAQPAIMAVSLAVLRVLEQQGGKPLKDLATYVAGHSLGEYAALCAAGSLTLADTARLLKIRGRAMQAAVPVGQGGMAAILGLELPQVREVAAEAAAGAVCATANDNAPGQVVVSGTLAAVERAVVVAQARGAKRSLMLNVSAPFHSPLMQPAADRMADALADATLLPPCVPLIANVTAAPVTDPHEIRALLVEQVTGMVRWRESMLFLREHEIEALVECGHGKVLAGLAKRIDRAFATVNLQGPADIDAFLETL
jgi:[acyl-carrier-protein] S-malonyltransferase